MEEQHKFVALLADSQSKNDRICRHPTNYHISPGGYGDIDENGIIRNITITYFSMNAGKYEQPTSKTSKEN